jgi:hypothetical protein
VTCLSDGLRCGDIVDSTARAASLGDSAWRQARIVKDLVAGSSYAFVSRGLHTLKGVPDEWELLAVT